MVPSGGSTYTPVAPVESSEQIQRQIPVYLIRFHVVCQFTRPTPVNKERPVSQQGQEEKRDDTLDAVTDTSMSRTLAGVTEVP